MVERERRSLAPSCAFLLAKYCADKSRKCDLSRAFPGCNSSSDDDALKRLDQVPHGSLSSPIVTQTPSPSFRVHALTRT
jgi:hypothetical protein